MNNPEKQEDTQKAIENEIQERVEKAMEANDEEVERSRELQKVLELKLQQLTNEYAVLKSDNEITKTKAREMLIKKDDEINRLKKKQSSSAGSKQGT